MGLLVEHYRRRLADACVWRKHLHIIPADPECFSRDLMIDVSLACLHDNPAISGLYKLINPPTTYMILGQNGYLLAGSVLQQHLVRDEGGRGSR